MKLKKTKYPKKETKSSKCNSMLYTSLTLVGNKDVTVTAVDCERPSGLAGNTTLHFSFKLHTYSLVTVGIVDHGSSLKLTCPGTVRTTLAPLQRIPKGTSHNGYQS